MKKLNRNLIVTAFLAVLTLAGSLFTASNFPVQVASAQTVGSTGGGGTQEGSDGKKKNCRPPRQCPTGNTNSGTGQGRTDSGNSNVTEEDASSDWWDALLDWVFGE